MPWSPIPLLQHSFAFLARQFLIHSFHHSFSFLQAWGMTENWWHGSPPGRMLFYWVALWNPSYTLTQVPPETGGTQTPRCGRENSQNDTVGRRLSITHNFLLVLCSKFPISDIWTSWKLYPLCLWCEVLFLWYTTSTCCIVLHQKVPKDLHGLSPTKVQIVRTCSADTDALTHGALATPFCHHRWWISRSMGAKFCNTEEVWVKLNSVLITQISWKIMTEIIF